ncbi:hypothetical protein PsYK624_024720 [Phanerochaete sordida]|uniref:Uncharacterized protein n=1 Tax=Phanerochaete sordida TaxID=48140 RepID=A0A9P3FZY9_9APHY|nr:hypothetical protein PsYK624_024720 [Phanerochaete sordida]
MSDPCCDICCGLCCLCACMSSANQPTGWCFFAKCCTPRNREDEDFADEVVREHQRETMNFAAAEPDTLESLKESRRSGNGVVNTQPKVSRSMDLDREAAKDAPAAGRASTQRAE